MRIIDFHMHPYLTHQEFSGMYEEVFFPDSVKERRDLEAAGICHICGSVIEKDVDSKKVDFNHIHSLNLKALQLRERYGGYYTPGCHIHPAYIRESCAEIEWMHQNGIRLIGELVPYMHGWSDYSNRGLAEILDVAEQFGMIVSYHTILQEQKEMEKMIAAHPGLTFVAAHPGEKESLLLHIERMRKYENAFLDLSGTGLFRYGMLAYCVKKAGAERILFGTDYPICNPRMYVQAVLQEPVTDREREAIFAGNAERLLGIYKVGIR